MKIFVKENGERERINNRKEKETTQCKGTVMK